MPRTSAVIHTDTWRRPYFRSLSVPAQLTYLIARTCPDTSRCGVTPLLYEKWAGMSGNTVEMTRSGVTELAARGAVFVDLETSEMFIPDSIRDEGVEKVPSMFERVLRDLAVVRSPQLRQLIVGELADFNTPRAVEAVECLRSGIPVPEIATFQNRHATSDRRHIKRMRGRFAGSAARLKLRSEIDAGLHVCPCGATAGLQVDHVVPLARGGTNDFANLQVLCASCNNSKGATVL